MLFNNKKLIAYSQIRIHFAPSQYNIIDKLDAKFDAFDIKYPESGAVKV